MHSRSDQECVFSDTNLPTTHSSTILSLQQCTGTSAPVEKVRLPQSSSISNDDTLNTPSSPLLRKEIKDDTTLPAKSPSPQKLSSSPPPPAASETSPYHMVVGCSHHKTGTFQLRCLMKQFAISGGLYEPIGRCFKDNSVTYLHMEDCYNNFANNETIPLIKPLMFKTFHGIRQTCRSYEDNEVGEPCLSLMTGRVCNQSMVEWMARPGTCSIELPKGKKMAFFNIIRNPIDSVLSAYSFHTERPKSEPWLFRPKNLTQLSHQLKWAGAEPETLISLGLGRGRNAEYSPYVDLLTALPPEKGVLLEFWHSLPEISSIARQYTTLSGHEGTVHVRFEDLRDEFNATVLTALNHYQMGSDPKAMLDAAVAGGCDPGTWTEAQIKASNHVTIGKKEGVKEAAEAALLAYPAAKRILCDLCIELAYQDPRCGADDAEW
jgi:hypothetical protein